MFEIKKVIQQAAILLAVFCMSDLIAGNSKAYINGSIHTFDENLTVTKSILVKDGVIELVGSQADVIKNTDESIEIVDLQGRMMMPSFHDAHAHPIWNGMDFLQCSVFDLLTINEIQDRIRACLDEDHAKTSGWVIGAGLNAGLFPAANPNKSLFDEVSEDIPIYIEMSDGHNALVNTKALELAGINRDTKDPFKGIIERDPITGEPSGTLREPSAMNLIADILPTETSELRLNGLKYAQNLASSYGITSMIDAAVNEPYLISFKDLAEKGELNLRITACIEYGRQHYVQEFSGFEDVYKRRSEFEHPRINTNCVKIFIDGVLEGQTGAILEPYLDSGSYGQLYFSQDELNNAIARFDANGTQVMTHAIGDRAVRSVLDAYQHAIKSNGMENNKHHISHLQLIHEEDIPRFSELNISANFQAAWALPDEWITEINIPELGVERVNRMYPIRSIHDSGGTIVGGSDWAVTTMNPLIAIETAVTRKDPSNRVQGTLNEKERMDLTEMLKAYTINAADVMHQGHLTGSIEAGKYADLIILEKNLFEIPLEEIGEVKVIETVLEGTTVFRIN
ncbi:amidohydrolase [Gammaproteobacteria bacterium]|nr:amidohydrolase [Gammaproteobacteria bacterium]